MTNDHTPAATTTARPLEPLDPTTLATNVLDHILSHRRRDVQPLAAMFEDVPDRDIPPSTRSLYHALGAGKRGHAHYLMECKSASPSLGKIRDPYYPGQIAKTYNQYASAISVLCEPRFFAGSYDHLATVAASTHLPVLCKDFIIDPVQVRAARYYGADAILLMLSALTDPQYRQLAQLAQRFQLDVLTEVSSHAELNRARDLGARIVGINNRDLRDLSIDTDRTRQYAPALPEDVVVISESGIKTNHDVRRLAPHVSGFLVGSSLMKRPDLDYACRELVYGRVKICGLRAPAQAQLAHACGATHGGFILSPVSPREVTPSQAQDLIDAAPELRWVAVLTTTDVPEIIHQIRPLLPHLNAVQIHAPAYTDEDGHFDLPAQQHWLTQLHTELRRANAGSTPTPAIWLGLSASRPADLEATAALGEHCTIVLDSGSGGSGATFDWRQIPAAARPHILLAGGIGPTNVVAARAENTWGLDLNSQLEYPRQPCKDTQKLRSTFTRLRHYPQPNRD